MTTQHIPAWKRLGLKLKNANEIASTSTSAADSNGVSKKRKQETATTAVTGSEPNHKRLKKLRVDNETSKDKLKTNSHDLGLETSGLGGPRKRKSVSFTPDTKVEDGDSAQTIQFWTPNTSDSTTNHDSDEISSKELPKPPKRAKTSKKSKSSKTTSSPTIPRKATAALDYLDFFHLNRSSWKFNKNHETWILKHALSPEHIPPQRSIALAAYVRGLQSAASRQRLAKQSREAIANDDSAAHISDETQVTLDQLIEKNFVGAEVGTDQESEQPSWLTSLHRGVVLLSALKEPIQHPNRRAQSNGTSIPRVKKNKSRTTRIEVESSSSESESESDSEEEGSNGSIRNKSTGQIRLETSTVGNVEDTSSSGSSSESSSVTSSDSEDSSDNDSIEE